MKEISIEIPILDKQQFEDLSFEVWKELSDSIAKTIRLQLWRDDFQGIDRKCSIVYEFNFAKHPRKGKTLSDFLTMGCLINKYIISYSEAKGSRKAKFETTGAFIHNISFRIGNVSVENDTIKTFIHFIK